MLRMQTGDIYTSLTDGNLYYVTFVNGDRVVATGLESKNTIEFEQDELFELVHIIFRGCCKQIVVLG